MRLGQLRRVLMLALTVCGVLAGSTLLSGSGCCCGGGSMQGPTSGMR